MSDTSAIRRKSQDELADLQTEHNRNRKRLVRNQEAELKELREHYDGRKEAVIEQGTDAVNHIKKAQTETLNQAQETRKKVQEQANQKSNAIEELYRKKVNETLKQREEQLAETRTSTQSEVQKFQTQNEEKLSKLRQKAAEQYVTTKERTQNQAQRLETQNEERIGNLRRETETQQKRELERGRQQLEKLRAENERNDQLARARAQEEIEARKESSSQKISRLESEAEIQYRKKQEHWQQREQRLDQDYQNKIGEREEAYRDRLKTQKQRFDSIYQKNDLAQRRSLMIQEANAAKQTNEIKKAFTRETEKYTGKAEDPFYKVQDRGSRLRETPDAYVIETYAPEHEKDKVRVVIENDKATIQGQRAFQDKFEAEDGRRVSTSSYQSFREEFPFESPVITEGMSRERDGDWIRVVVPKLTRFSRKA